MTYMDKETYRAKVQNTNVSHHMILADLKIVCCKTHKWHRLQCNICSCSFEQLRYKYFVSQWWFPTCKGKNSISSHTDLVRKGGSEVLSPSPYSNPKKKSLFFPLFGKRIRGNKKKRGEFRSSHNH